MNHNSGVGALRFALGRKSNITPEALAAGDLEQAAHPQL